MRETTYDKKLIIILSLIIIVFLFCLGFIFIPNDSRASSCIISIASSLLSSFIFFFVFLNFENSIRNEKYYKRIGINKSFDSKYWIDLIKHLNNTKEDVIFYGNTLSRWLGDDYKNELIDRIKSKEEGKVYFILHNEEYFNEWEKLFSSTIVKTIKKDGAAPYSAVCVGNRINVVIHPGRSLSDKSDQNNNSLTIEMERYSTMGRQYINYLNECIKN